MCEKGYEIPVPIEDVDRAALGRCKHTLLCNGLGDIITIKSVL